MKQRVRKAHSKSRKGCIECKRRHHKCDERYPICGQCQRLETACSLSVASPSPGIVEDAPLAIDDLLLLHHWHNASREDDFAAFEDHAHLDRKEDYNRTVELSFRSPYLLHSLLAISALHMLNAKGGGDARLYQLASAHNLSSMKLARPQVAGGDAGQRDAVFNFAAFSSLYATAEPPLRIGDAAIVTAADTITALLDAFRMSKGVRAVQEPFLEELKSSGSIKPGLWTDNRDQVIPTLEVDYPQLKTLSGVILEHCEARQQQPCLDALRSLFVCIGVFATNSKRHSSLRLIQTWPMDLDPICLDMFGARHPVGLLLLAHYAALMGMRRNYWFCSRWPALLLRSVTELLPHDWQPYVEWPRSTLAQDLPT